MILSGTQQRVAGGHLTTKRIMMANVSMCIGCCCGQSRKGHFEVPVGWLKKEWKLRGLLKHMQLTISGCLGPCDVANVVRISSASGEQWLGGLTEIHQYRDLMDWASLCKQEGRLMALPSEFKAHFFDPY
jgi:hypothetical protein